MTARIRNLNTNFTRLLEGKVRHTVRIVTQTETLECSGAVLSQHSHVMRNLVEEQEEIQLSDYKFARECLTILHGGSVEINNENCEEIVRFGIQFGVTEVTEQGLEYLASITDESSLKSSVDVCYNACRLAGSCNLGADIDYFWPLECTIDKLSTAATNDFVTDIKSTVGIKAILEMIKSRALALKLFNSFVSFIDQSNIEEVLAAFSCFESCETYAEAFADCPDDEISSFLEGIQALELKEEQMKIFENLKTCMVQESETNGLKLKSNKEDLTTSWRRFTEEEIVQVCKVFQTDFYIVEVIMSWVALNRPDLKTVRHLCSLVDTAKLEKQYLEHVAQVLKTEGYAVSFDLENCRSESEDNLEISKQVDGLTLNFGDTQEVTSKTLSAKYTELGWFGHSTYTYTVTVSKDGVRWEGASKNCTKLFGRTMEGRQIPFYTDQEAALRVGMVFDVQTLGCLQ